MRDYETNDIEDLEELIRLEKKILQPEINFIKFLIKSILYFTIFTLVIALIISLIQSYTFYGGIT